MPRLAGKAGMVKVDTDGGANPEELLAVTNWTLNTSADALEATGTDSSGHRAFIAGLDGWSGSVSAHWDTDEADIIGNPPLISIGARIEIELLMSPTALNRYKGDALVTAVNPECNIDGTVDYSIDFQGTEVLTYPTA